MTERAEDIAQTAAAIAAGMAATNVVIATDAAQLEVEGSEENVAATALGADDGAVDGIGSPGQQPSALANPSGHSPNILNAADAAHGQP